MTLSVVLAVHSRPVLSYFTLITTRITSKSGAFILLSPARAVAAVPSPRRLLAILSRESCAFSCASFHLSFTLLSRVCHRLNGAVYLCDVLLAIFITYQCQQKWCEGEKRRVMKRRHLFLLATHQWATMFNRSAHWMDTAGNGIYP